MAITLVLQTRTNRPQPEPPGEATGSPPPLIKLSDSHVGPMTLFQAKWLETA
jgi:hypothetical protein